MDIYLAGPDVFFADALALGAAKKAICARYGLRGHHPFDNAVELSATPECGYRISRLNEDLIARCDAVVANLTPFRGVSADPGTVFELGYAAGLGKAVHGYSCETRFYRARVFAADAQAQGDLDGAGHVVEDFGLADNLMIEGAIHRRGGIFIAEQGDNLAVFERVLRRLAERAG